MSLPGEGFRLLSRTVLQKALLSWLDAHAGAVSAIATVVLVVITAWYVVVTYLLVKEQRLQGHLPEVVFELIGGDVPAADLKLRNVGTGTAAELTLLAGPREGVPAKIPGLGHRTVLLPGDSCEWPIRPPDGEPGFSPGRLSLTMQYFDNHRSKVFFEVLVLEFETLAEGWTVRNVGSIEIARDRRELRRLTRKSLPPRGKVSFQWRTRHRELPYLLLDDEVRRELRASLGRTVDELMSLRPQMEELRTAL